MLARRESLRISATPELEEIEWMEWEVNSR